MSKKQDYLRANQDFLTAKAQEEGVKSLPGGILYKVISEGTGTTCPTLRSIVCVHYRGSLVNGREFDNSYERGYPEAFRLNEVIEGWQIALSHMHAGDKWVIYIPAEKGYGKRSSGPIPGGSTLVFEVELLSIG